MVYSRNRLTAANGSNDINHNPTFHVKTVADGGDDNNDGQSENTALATIQAAVNRVKDDIDTSGYAPVIKIHDGLHLGWQDYGPVVGRHKKGGGPIIYIGNFADPSAVRIFHNPGTAVISFDGYAQGVIVGMEVIGNQSPSVYATNGSIIEAGLMNVSGPTPFLADSFGKIICTSTIKFIGSMVYGGMANKAALFEMVPGVIVQFADCTFGQHFLFGANHGICIVPYVPGNPVAGVTFVGSFTGQKAFASLLGVVNSGYGTYNSYPGTIDAGMNTGGQLN